MRTILTGLVACLALTAAACGSGGYTYSKIDDDLGHRPFTMTAAQVAAQSPTPYRDLGLPEGDNPRQIERCYGPEKPEAVLHNAPAYCFEFVDGAMYRRSAQYLRFQGEALEDFEALWDSGNDLHGQGERLFFKDAEKRCIVRPSSVGGILPFTPTDVYRLGEDDDALEEAYEAAELCGKIEWRRGGTPVAAVTLRPSWAHDGLYEVVLDEYTPDALLHAKRKAMLEATALDE